VELTYIKQAGEPVGDGGDQYTGLDRFGRVIDQRWPQGASELERVDYGYTRASNRQWRQELVASGQDEYYNYDGLYQVAASNRGTLNSGKTGISGTPSWTEDFNYDPIGNWNNYLTKVSGVTDLDQSRTHNTANQTTEIDGSTATVAHDPAGNMVKVPQVADWASSNELKWDAWNRLVAVKAGATTVAAYGYDGLNRRTTKTVSGTTRRYYYSDQWQIVEERLNSDTTAERRFVWGLRYLDDLVLRDRDVDHDASMDERLYVLSDYFNPTAIADEDGVVLERYGYDAFGLSRVMTPSFEPRSSSDFDWETRYGAYRYDPETGFYQVRYRYLHPPLGRWLSRDPIGEKGGVNLYGMVGNNPLNRMDFLGLADTELHHVIPEWLARYSAYGSRDQGFCIRLTKDFHRLSTGFNLEAQLTPIRNQLKAGLISPTQAYNRVLMVHLRNLPAIIRNNRAAVGISGGSAVVFRGAIQAGLAQIQYFTAAEAALGATGVGTLAIAAPYLTSKGLELGEYNNYNLVGQSEADLFNSQVGIASRAAQLDGSAILSVANGLADCPEITGSECARKFQAALNRNYFFIQTMGVSQFGVSLKQARETVSEGLFLDYLRCLEGTGCCVRLCG
jgi:RHS repeat-associated protein